MMGIFATLATISAVGFGRHFHSAWLAIGVWGALVSIAWFIEEVM